MSIWVHRHFNSRNVDEHFTSKQGKTPSPFSQKKQQTNRQNDPHTLPKTSKPRKNDGFQ